MKTVRDFKDYLITRIGGTGPTDFDRFTSQSLENAKFWGKLNKLGARNMDEQPPETVDDIDATVQLSDQEWAELEAELEQLLS